MLRCCCPFLCCAVLRAVPCRTKRCAASGSQGVRSRGSLDRCSPVLCSVLYCGSLCCVLSCTASLSRWPFDRCTCLLSHCSQPLNLAYRLWPLQARVPGHLTPTLTDCVIVPLRTACGHCRRGLSAQAAVGGHLTGCACLLLVATAGKGSQPVNPDPNRQCMFTACGHCRRGLSAQAAVGGHLTGYACLLLACLLFIGYACLLLLAVTAGEGPQPCNPDPNRLCMFTACGHCRRGFRAQAAALLLLHRGLRRCRSVLRVHVLSASALPHCQTHTHARAHTASQM